MTAAPQPSAELPPELVADILERCDRHPDRVALRYGGTSTTYAELGAGIRATAHALRARGMADGDRMLFSVRPRSEGMVLALGTVAAGGSVVLVDPGSAPELFAARVAAAAPSWAATESLLHLLGRWPLTRLARRRGLLLPAYASLPVRHVHAGRRLPGVPRASVRARDLARAAGQPRADRPRTAGQAEVTRTPDAEALVVFTSGTTAAPRAVVHTRGSLGAGTRLLRQVLDLAPGDVVHTDQMLLGLPALVAGGSWSLPDRSPAEDVVGYARGLDGAAASFLVPADVTALLDAIDAGRVPATGPRTMLVGGAPVTAGLLERARTTLPGTRWVGVYGMTEVLPIAVVEADEKIAARSDGDLVGRPLEGVHARIDPHPDAPVDGVGELVLSGPSLMRGYLLDGPADEHRTGDLARWDDAGRILLVGRTRDMLIRGTTNIYPGLFEPRLARLPGVREALVVGVPRPGDADEEVVLVVVPEGAGGDDGEAGGGVRLRRDPALERRLRRLLPDVLDHDALPDHVLVTDRVPVGGRSRKPDRAALSAAAGRLLREGDA